MELTNSKRILRSASYVVTELTADEQVHAEQQQDGRAFEKINFIRQLKITPEDVTRAGHSLEERLRERFDPERFRRGLANLSRLTEALNIREQRPANNLLYAQLAASVLTALLVGVAESLNSQAIIPHTDWKIETFKKRMKTAPVGRLHLEQIEIYPAGVQRGELVFTVPLAPLETITISHKEWSTSSEEYEQMVQDYSRATASGGSRRRRMPRCPPRANPSTRAPLISRPTPAEATGLWRYL